MGRCCDCCEEGVESFTVDDLLDEINSRLSGATNRMASKYGLFALDDLSPLRAAIRRGDLTEAEYLFEQAILPKWRDVEECRTAWLKATAPSPPAPKRGLWQYL